MKNHPAKCDCDDCSAGRAYDSAMKKGDGKDWIAKKGARSMKPTTRKK